MNEDDKNRLATPRECVEVTDEMIRAGVDAYKSIVWQDPDTEYIVSEVFKAMCLAGLARNIE